DIPRRPASDGAPARMVSGTRRRCRRGRGPGVRRVPRHRRYLAAMLLYPALRASVQFLDGAAAAVAGPAGTTLQGRLRRSRDTTNHSPPLHIPGTARVRLTGPHTCVRKAAGSGGGFGSAEACRRGVSLPMGRCAAPVPAYWAWLTDDMWKSGTRSAGIFARVAQSPHSRGSVYSLAPASVARRSTSSGLSLNRKLFTAAVTSPSSTRYTPSRVRPVTSSVVGSTVRMYQNVVSSSPRSGRATMSRTLAVPPVINRWSAGTATGAWNSSAAARG